MKGAKRVKNFHLPLSEEIHSELREVAEHLEVPATQVVREVLESWLRERKRVQLHQQIQSYAADASGAEALDADLEEAGIDSLLRAAEPSDDGEGK